MKLMVANTIVSAVATALILLSGSGAGMAQETSPTTSADESTPGPSPDDGISATTTNSSNSPVHNKDVFPPGAVTITFEEAAVPTNASVTDQYAHLGVIFSSATSFVQNPQPCTLPGLSGGCLGLRVNGLSCPGPQSIFFRKPTGIAGFNIVTNSMDDAALTARLGGEFVETHAFVTDAASDHFIGIKNSGGFDELVMEIIPDAGTEGSNGCPLIDNLMFAPVVPVHIDIKPDSDQNSINLCSNGSVPVAILGSSALNVYEISSDTLRFAAAGVKLVGKKDPRVLCSHEDVNFDGFTDLLCHYLTADIAAIDGESSSATMNGSLFDGTLIEGTDGVRVVKDTCM